MHKGAKPRRPLLSVERLEAREVPATASLSGSTLTIDGTKGDDSIIVRQNGTQITIDGVRIRNGSREVTSVTTEQVQQVVIRAGNGNDTINFGTLKVPAKVWGGTGKDRVYCGNGNDRVYGDQGNDTILGSSGNDWLVGGEGADQIWGGAGNDWITGDNGEDWLSGDAGNDTISGGEGKDTLSGGSGSDILDGHGFGMGAADAARNFDVYRNEFDLWRPIPWGATGKELMKKGQFDDPGHLAALGALSSADIKSSIRVVAKGIYDVTLHGDKRTIRVEFDGSYNDNDPKPTDGATPGFAMILLHRARLISLGIDPKRFYSNADWEMLNVRAGGRLYDVAHALRQFTGRSVVKLAPYLTSFSALKHRLDRGAAIVAYSYRAAKRTANKDGIMGDTEYVVRRLFADSRGKQWVELYNPLGTDCGNGRLLDKAPGTFKQNDGLITMAWDDFRRWANFTAMYVS